jgi:hypothetical protein
VLSFFRRLWVALPLLYRVNSWVWVLPLLPFRRVTALLLGAMGNCCVAAVLLVFPLADAIDAMVLPNLSPLTAVASPLTAVACVLCYTLYR